MEIIVPTLGHTAPESTKLTACALDGTLLRVIVKDNPLWGDPEWMQECESPDNLVYTIYIDLFNGRYDLRHGPHRRNEVMSKLLVGKRCYSNVFHPTCHRKMLASRKFEIMYDFLGGPEEVRLIDIEQEEKARVNCEMGIGWPKEYMLMIEIIVHQRCLPLHKLVQCPGEKHPSSPHGQCLHVQSKMFRMRQDDLDETITYEFLHPLHFGVEVAETIENMESMIRCDIHENRLLFKMAGLP